MTDSNRVSTESLDLALEQLVRARIVRGKVSINTSFMLKVIKELLDRRLEEEEILDEVEDLLDEELRLAEYDDIQVEEIMDLEELGHSSWVAESDIDEIHERDLLPEAPTKRKDRVLRSDFNGRILSRWQDNSTTRRVIIFTLIAVIVLTFGSLLV